MDKEQLNTEGRTRDHTNVIKPQIYTRISICYRSLAFSEPSVL